MSLTSSCVTILIPQESSLQRTFSFDDHTIKVVYPPVVGKIVDRVFSDFEQGSERLEAPSLSVKYDHISGRYNLSYPGIKEKTGILLHDLGQQLLVCANTALFNNFTTDLAVYAGAVAKGKRAILLPGTAGVGKSFLTAWFLSQSYSYLTDNLVCVRDKDHAIRNLQQPLSFKKSGRQYLYQMLAPESSEEIIEGTITDLVPWRLFSNLDKVNGEISAAILVFSEFRPGADLSLEALTPAQAALLLLASAANGRNLPGHGFPNVSRICKDIPALRLIYGESRQLSGVLDRMVNIILDYNLAPADLVAFAAPFNRNKHLEELIVPSTFPLTTTSQPGEGSQENTTVSFPVQLATPKGHKKKLTIGMATYDDYDGVYFSVQALRLYHPEILNEIEILVVDNHPDGPCAEALKKLDESVPSYRYIPEQYMRGPVVRDIIFREGSGEYVIVIDCHVLIVPGAIRKLLDYFDKNKNSRDLLQGPLLGDNLINLATNYKPVWRSGMYGIWETDERGLKEDGEPFEIHAQGTGLFSCRRDAWLGFNPRFRGFAGEEGYIHEKFRQAGGKVLCLPFLRWLHRFGRPLGVPYKIDWGDRIFNFMVGHQELGINRTLLKAHFVELLGEKVALKHIALAEKEIESPFYFFDAIYCICMDKKSHHWTKTLARFKALDIAERVRVFQAISTPQNNDIGSALSHRSIILHAQQYQFKNVLVFEDDEMLMEDTFQRLAGSIEELKKQDWNIFYLGGYNSSETFPFADGCSSLQRPEGLTCTHALAYNSSIYNTLLDELPETIADMALWVKHNGAIGQYLKKLKKLFVATPAVASQPILLHNGQK